MNNIVNQLKEAECVVKISHSVSGIITYTKDGQYHRLDGPALESSYTKNWYQNGKMHRLDGPAVEMANGDKHWYQNGKRHRLDGPAVEHGYGYKEWWIEGINIDCKTREEFERLIRLKAFW